MSRGADAEAFERCMAVGGVAVFPSDTVYGLACDAQNRLAVERLYALKRRRLEKPSAVMFFDPEVALGALPELGERTRAALSRLLPGPLTALVPNPATRFPLACGDDPTTLGLRVPVIAPLAGVRWPVLQSSANVAGGPEAQRLDDVDASIRRRADMLIDGGELPGTASTVIDLRDYDTGGEWSVVRHGALPETALAEVLGDQFHFHPDGYDEEIREDIPDYDRFQDEVTAASGEGATRILELGSGTGATAARLLAHHPGARLVGVDVNPGMLDAARARVGEGRASFTVARLQDPLPEGPFEVVATALCVHHLAPAEKQDLFARVRAALVPGGVFVLGDVVLPEPGEEAVVPLTPGYDKPSLVADQLAWLAAAGFAPEITWARGDLAVIRARAVD